MKLKKQAGMSLIEIMISMAIIMSIIGLVLYYQGKANAANQSKDTITAVSNMAGKIKNFYASTGSYDGITTTIVNGMSIVGQPLTGSGANIRDPWGNAMSVVGNAAGAAPSFVITLGGATVPLDKESCVAMAQALSNSAVAVAVGPAATVTTTNGTVGPAGNLYKTSAGVLSVSNLTTGCGGTSPVIAIQYN